MSSISKNSPHFNWCPYVKYTPSNPSFGLGDYSTVKESGVPPVFRDRNENTKMPKAPAHGGLFRGPVKGQPWEAIPVTPTMSNYIHHNLRSANPPPGATEQFVGGDRLGNNYAPMPGTYWYNPTNNLGNYNMVTTHHSDAVRNIQN